MVTSAHLSQSGCLTTGYCPSTRNRAQRLPLTRSVNSWLYSCTILGCVPLVDGGADGRDLSGCQGVGCLVPLGESADAVVVHVADELRVAGGAVAEWRDPGFGIPYGFGGAGGADLVNSLLNETVVMVELLS